MLKLFCWIKIDFMSFFQAILSQFEKVAYTYLYQRTILNMIMSYTRQLSSFNLRWSQHSFLKCHTLASDVWRSASISLFYIYSTWVTTLNILQSCQVLKKCDIFVPGFAQISTLFQLQQFVQSTILNNQHLNNARTNKCS